MDDEPESCFSSPLTAAWGFKLAVNCIDNPDLPFLPKEAYRSIREICDSSFLVIIDFLEKQPRKENEDDKKVVDFAEAINLAEPL